VTSRLHDNAALDAQHGMQREQAFLRRVGWCERTVGGEWKSCRGPEDVAMRVAGTARQSKRRLAR